MFEYNFFSIIYTSFLGLLIDAVLINTKVRITNWYLLFGNVIVTYRFPSKEIEKKWEKTVKIMNQNLYYYLLFIYLSLFFLEEESKR